MAKRSKLAAVLEETAGDTTVRAVAASAVAAGGALAAGKVVRERVTSRALRRRARRYRLEPGETPAEGLTRIARAQLDLTTGLLEHPPRGDRGADAIHEARKALKRLRALLRVSRDAIGDERYRRENVLMRDAGRELSTARDARVLLETLDSLAKEFPDAVEDGTWSDLRKSLADSARDAAQSSREATAGVLSVLSDARADVESWQLPDHGGMKALAPGFGRIYRRGRQALRAAEADPSTENLHELRKRSKDLWHAAQLLRCASPNRMKKLARSAHRLADLLGDDHDLSVLLERARQRPEEVDRAQLEALRAVIERRRHELCSEAFARAERLYRRKPKRMLRRLALA
jgi:CHAD domain-containing protein